MPASGASSSLAALPVGLQAQGAEVKELSPKKLYIVIPVLNEGQVIQDVLREIKETGYHRIIVVDDGSKDDSSGKAKEMGAVVLKHIINRGKGAAVKTGIEAAKILKADMVVTMDGDGQHNPQDIDKMIRHLEQGTDVVLGSRLLNAEGMPTHKWISNHLGNFFTWLIHGLWVTDSQSGFRAYSRKALNVIDTKTDRYEYDSEIISQISKHQLKYAEVPVDVRYTEYSMGKKHKQNLKNGIKTLIKMIISE
ncbi:MAG: glycosyltransferase family 2 protein [Thermodesulfobacteriota bacterium]